MRQFEMRRPLLGAAVLGMGAIGVPASALEPANLQWGSVFITPTLDSRLEYVDNLFRTPDNKKETGLSVIEPKVQAWLQNGLNTYSFDYRLTDWRYFDSSDDDYTDHRFNIDVHHEFNARNVWNIYGEYWDTHEQRGTGLSEGVANLIDEPVEYERESLGTDYTLGNRNSRGRVTLEYKYQDIEYQNFRADTQYRDRDTDRYRGTFFWKVGSRTDVLAEVNYQEVRYDLVDPLRRGGSFDSDEYNYFLGVSWEPTARTSGSVKLGSFDRRYQSARREDDDGFSWQIDAFYTPRSYSVFHLTSGRFSQETNGLGDSVNTQETRLDWDHDWNGRASTRLSALFRNEDYSGSDRQDDVYGVELGYSYALRRWLDLGAGYRYEDRNSDLDLYDYDRNRVYLEARFSL
ncbi:outer membrane beta-barrel protein [Seongchinamella unica]|nr:outer membrane beta-barrel protein [Seongchinamella unica]